MTIVAIKGFGILGQEIIQQSVRVSGVIKSKKNRQKRVC